MVWHLGIAVITQVEDVGVRWRTHSELVSTLRDALRRPLLRDLTEQRLLLQGQVRVIALQLADAETCRAEGGIDNEQADEPAAEQHQHEQDKWNPWQWRCGRDVTRAGGCGGRLSGGRLRGGSSRLTSTRL